MPPPIFNSRAAGIIRSSNSCECSCNPSRWASAHGSPINGQISVGAIIAASVLLSRALQPVEQLVGLWPNIVQSRQALKTLDRVFKQAADGPATRTTLPDPKGLVELDRVVVRNADGSAMLLKNASLKLTPGEVLGVIGPSGAGKTTLARVVAGALSPDFGEVRIDEASMADWDPEQLAQHIGYLPQDCGLLPGTISENISRFACARGFRSRSSMPRLSRRRGSAERA